MRCRGIPDKPFEWNLARAYLGEDYPYRGKQGFIFPFEEWLRDKTLFDAIEAVILNVRLGQAVGFRPEALEGMVKALMHPRAPAPWSRVWSLFVLLDWCERNRVFL